MGEHELTVRNDSDAAVTSQPSATEGQSDVTLTFEPATLTIAPGQSAVAHVRVSPQRMLLLGRERTHRFGIDAGQGVKVAGAMVQQPRLPRGMLLAAALAIVAAVVGIAIAVGTGGSSQPKVTVPSVAGSSTADAINTLLTTCQSPCFVIAAPSLVFDSRDPGTVIATAPAEGAVVSRGTKVALIVSRGPLKVSCGIVCQTGIFNSVKQATLKLNP